MLAAGDRVPEATVWQAPRDAVSVRELAPGRSKLFLFYLFD